MWQHEILRESAVGRKRHWDGVSYTIHQATSSQRWPPKRRQFPKQLRQVVAHQHPGNGTLAAMIAKEGLPLPRGATLPRSSSPQAFEHAPNRPARKMTALETAQWLRHHAKKQGQAWPLA
jgi:hypothetical protein